MEHYQNFSVDDFLQDETFIEWVKNPTPESNLFWEEWLQQNPRKETIVKQAKDIIQSFDFAPEQIPDAFYTRLKDRIDATIQQQARGKVRRLYFRGLAAAIFIGVLVTSGILYFDTSRQADFISVSSDYAQTKEVVLPDSSIVVLNAHSDLKYAADWKIGNRELWLNGEGFFKVRHIEEKANIPVKFVVHAGDLNIEVVGTEFNVKDRELTTEVLLTSGRVNLTTKNGTERLVLMPNDLAIYDEQKKHLDTRQVSPVMYTAWLQHKYIFDKTPLREIARNLQHYYGTPIIIENDNLAMQELSGTLELQNEQTLLQTLSVLLKQPVKKVDNKIIISSN